MVKYLTTFVNIFLQKIAQLFYTNRELIQKTSYLIEIGAYLIFQYYLSE